MKELYELKDMLLDKLKEYSKKGDLTASTLDVVDKLSHAAKNVCKLIEDVESEGSYSRGHRQQPYYEDHSYARRRDNTGRYSRGDSMMHELHELMESAPDDKTRQEFQRFIQKMEHM